ncbi:hypothetical protein QE429_003707 [Bacillus sp. SORGH_AS 510]|uniref:DUF4349 domain-containing protein n=1 Tax=Bacillus sp. SORGH_AS_0510 TaxID=3041771 RepID=UPI0027896F53|nr:DUF4349 domain-containing protein [Bacillus sp. SORGH_AS_0510]MDQ1146880.1 hypothetical protein [Bacillus sp. SORGH_AS_0510]
MRKRILKWVPVYLLIMFIGLAGCSSSSKNESAKMSDEKTVMDSAASGNKGETSNFSSEKSKGEQTSEPGKFEGTKQMVIYQADLQLKVKKFEKTVQSLEEKAVKYGGYISQSNVAREGNEQISGTITIRVPQKYFQTFLHDAEGEAVEVLQRNISGQDVTEEYVDLESRLKSKRVVEERLLTFMKNAAKTEDLLKISADLAGVQEEIETIEGRMKYLENQTSLSTVTITLFENKVIVPDIDKDQLNTWEKTKKQFMKSTNMLLAFMSGLVVFIIGNLPILIVLGILVILGFLLFKKGKTRNKQD